MDFDLAKLLLVGCCPGVAKNNPLPFSILQNLAEQWHAPEKVDRSVCFMIASGRPEFSDLVWPLVTHANDQVQLHALQASKQIRPSVFGSDAPTRIAALPSEIRKIILHEIASNSGIDSLDLANSIAKSDSEPEVKVTVVVALSFRRADRHRIRCAPPY